MCIKLLQMPTKQMRRPTAAKEGCQFGPGYGEKNKVIFVSNAEKRADLLIVVPQSFPTRKCPRGRMRSRYDALDTSG